MTVTNAMTVLMITVVIIVITAIASIIVTVVPFDIHAMLVVLAFLVLAFTSSGICNLVIVFIIDFTY